jgi:hypothetical protein
VPFWWASWHPAKIFLIFLIVDRFCFWKYEDHRWNGRAATASVVAIFFLKKEQKKRMVRRDFYLS